MSQYDPTFDLKISHFLPIFHSSVILPCIYLIVECLSQCDDNKCRSQQPIFYVSSDFVLYLGECTWMNVILWDNESVWCDDWSYNKYRSQWPIFHGPVILSYILRSNLICSDNESVWCDDWPYNKCRSQGPIFHGPGILPHYALMFALLFFLCTQIILVSLAKCDSGERKLLFRMRKRHIQMYDHMTLCSITFPLRNMHFVKIFVSVNACNFVQDYSHFLSDWVHFL